MTSLIIEAIVLIVLLKWLNPWIVAAAAAVWAVALPYRVKWSKKKEEGQ